MASVMINEKGNYQLMVFCLRKKEYIFVEFDLLDAVCIQENLHAIEHYKSLKKKKTDGKEQSNRNNEISHGSWPTDPRIS